MALPYLKVPEHFFGVFKVASACICSAVISFCYFKNVSGKLVQILITLW